jgi:hypothetical protein
MSSDLAKTAFSTGVDETLAAVDVYGQSTANDNTSSSGEDVALSSDTVSALVGQPTESISNLIEPSDQGLILNADLLKSNILTSIPDASGVLNNLPSDLQGNLLSGGGPSDVQATVNGVTGMINTADMSSLKGVSSLIGQVSGSDFPISLQDNAGLTTLSTNLITQSCTMGIPGAYTQIASGLSSNPSMLTKATMGALPTVISSGNIGMLGEIASGPVAGNIAALSPGLASSFMTSFKLPSGLGTSTVAQLGASVVSAFSSLAPSWNKTASFSSRPTAVSYSSINSSSLLLNASSDFQKMFQTASAAKVTPFVVQPTVTRTQTVLSLPDSTLEFPPGTTSVAVTNQDQSKTTTYTTPSGLVCVRTLDPDNVNASSIYNYPKQYPPAPAPKATSSYYSSHPVAPSYVPSTNSLLRSAPTILASIPSSINNVFNIPSFGSGATATSATISDGSAETVVTSPNGSTYTYRTYNDGSVEQEILASAPSTGYDITEDPFVNLATQTAEDPITMGAAMCSLHDQAQQDVQDSSATPYLTMSAADALVAAFPQTDLGELQDPGLT